MKRSELNDVAIFVAVAQANGFRAAADNLKLGAGSVSEAVQRFEDRLGVRLIERSTRAMRLTQTGKQLYRRCLPAIDELENALSDLHTREEGLSGTLRLTAPIGASQLFLNAMTAEFALAHPALTVEVVYDEEKVDLVTSGVDAAIRAENLLDPDTHAIAIGPTQEMMIVASPTYFAGAEPLTCPADVAAHNGICFAFAGSEKLAPWVFKSKEGPITVMPTQRIVTNNLASVLSYAEAGLGLAYVLAHSAQSKLEGGQLVQVLEGAVADLPGFSLNYLSQRNIPARVRAFIDFVKRYR